MTFFACFAVLEALRCVRRLANSAIDLPLEAKLRIVDDERAPDEDVEQRGDVFSMHALDLRTRRFLEPGGQLGDLRIGRCRRIVLRHVEEDEIVVVGECDRRASTRPADSC